MIVGGRGGARPRDASRVPPSPGAPASCLPSSSGKARAQLMAYQVVPHLVGEDFDPAPAGQEPGERGEPRPCAGSVTHPADVRRSTAFACRRASS